MSVFVRIFRKTTQGFLSIQQAIPLIVVTAASSVAVPFVADVTTETLVGNGNAAAQIEESETVVLSSTQSTFEARVIACSPGFGDDVLECLAALYPNEWVSDIHKYCREPSMQGLCTQLMPPHEDDDGRATAYRSRFSELQGITEEVARQYAARTGAEYAATSTTPPPASPPPVVRHEPPPPAPVQKQQVTRMSASAFDRELSICRERESGHLVGCLHQRHGEAWVDEHLRYYCVDRFSLTLCSNIAPWDFRNGKNNPADVQAFGSVAMQAAARVADAGARLIHVATSDLDYDHHHDSVSSAPRNSTETLHPRDHGLQNGKIPGDQLKEAGKDIYGATILLWPPAADAFMNMKEAAARDGVSIGLTDHYRTFRAQQILQAQKGTYGKGGLAAVPGTSNHGWGTAIDVSGADPGRPAGDWLRKNGNRFCWNDNLYDKNGDEPWHYVFTISCVPSG